MKFILFCFVLLITHDSFSQFILEDSLSFHDKVKTVSIMASNGQDRIIHYDRNGIKNAVVSYSPPSISKRLDSTAWTHNGNTRKRERFIGEEGTPGWELEFDETTYYLPEYDSVSILYADGSTNYRIEWQEKMAKYWKLYSMNANDKLVDTVVFMFDQSGRIKEKTIVENSKLLGQSIYSYLYTYSKTGKIKRKAYHDRTSSSTFHYDDEGKLIRIITEKQLFRGELGKEFQKKHGGFLRVDEEGYIWEIVYKTVLYSYYKD